MNTALKSLTVIGVLTCATSAHAQVLQGFLHPNNGDAFEEWHDFQSLHRQNGEAFEEFNVYAAEAAHRQAAQAARVAKQEDQAPAVARTAEQEAKSSGAAFARSLRE